MDWKSVLKKAGYPTTALVLDFETYFDDIYSLKKMSTVEYVCDPRFELTGLGIQVLGEGLGGPGEDTATFILPNKIQLLFEGYVEQDKKWFRNCTIIGQNLKFDCLILKEHFGIVPQYTVDVRDLDRIWDARDSHKLEYMAKKWKAPSLKGDTQTWTRKSGGNLKNIQKRMWRLKRFFLKSCCRLFLILILSCHWLLRLYTCF
jgi:hypothetical protein